MRRNRIANVLIGIGYAMFVLEIILVNLLSIGTDDQLYYKYQMEAGVLDYAGISEADLCLLDRELAYCLSGNDMRPVNIEVFGKLQSAFNERELTHLEDCRKLFDLAYRVYDFVEDAAFLPIVFGICILKKKSMANCYAMWIACLAVFAPISILGIWAAIDFNSAFTFFHEILFTNDLWLLSWNTDLLIRICPASMFASMGLRILLWSLGLALIPPALVTLAYLLIPKLKRKRKSL